MSRVAVNWFGCLIEIDPPDDWRFPMKIELLICHFLGIQSVARPCRFNPA